MARYLSDPPDDFTGLSVKEAAQVIREWFLENFEDPAEITPYESAEGEYQWIWGGPYDAREVISDEFADTASEEIIEAAIEAVESNGLYEWAPHRNRIREDDEEPPDERDTIAKTPEALHAEMLERLAELEKALAEVPDPPAGIGHNRPPEAIAYERNPLTVEEKQIMRGALAVLKNQPVVPEEEPRDAVEAAGLLLALGKKLGSYLDVFLSEFAKSAGQEAGKWAVKLPAWKVLATSLLAAGAAAVAWLQSLPWPF